MKLNQKVTVTDAHHSVAYAGKFPDGSLHTMRRKVLSDDIGMIEQINKKRCLIIFSDGLRCWEDSDNLTPQ